MAHALRRDASLSSSDEAGRDEFDGGPAGAVPTASVAAIARTACTAATLGVGYRATLGSARRSHGSSSTTTTLGPLIPSASAARSPSQVEKATSCMVTADGSVEAATSAVKDAR